MYVEIVWDSDSRHVIYDDGLLEMQCLKNITSLQKRRQTNHVFAPQTFAVICFACDI